MSTVCHNKTAREIIDLYFIENRARLLDIASFLDRIDRYDESGAGKNDFRYKAFLKALAQLLQTSEDRTKALQMIFSDPTTEPLERAMEKAAFGAWEGACNESD
jgi:hypothetical protein